MFQRVCFSAFLATIFLVAPLASDQGVLLARDNPSEFSNRILSLTDVILSRHIDPPTRQQMILDGVKSIYLASEEVPPQGLVERVSELGSREQTTDYLDSVQEEFNDVDNLETIFTQGLLGGLPGESYILEAKESEINEQVINNRYVGTGIALTLNAEEGLTQIARVFHNGPAWKAGIKPLDLILEIDGNSVKSSSLADVVEALRGEAGSDVETVVRQPGSAEKRKLTMTRNRVFIPSVEGVREKSDGQWEYRVDVEKGIALLRFKSIGPSTLHELRQISAKLLKQDVKGIVIDLREGGGILHDIVMVADSLIDQGAIGKIRSHERTVVHEARPGDLFKNIPVVVLVAKSTSAGNVFLTAALQDNRRAVVVGEPTGGETYVNSFVPVPGSGDQLKLATAVMHRGDGTPLLRSRLAILPRIARRNSESIKPPSYIVPDHLVVQPPRNLDRHAAASSDPLLDKAIEVLSTGAAQASVSNSEFQGG